MSAIAALPAHAARASDGMRAPDSVSAWRTVFDREQSAALDIFRSVKAPAFTAASRGAAPVATSRGNSGLAPFAAGAAGNASAASAATNNLARGPLQAGISTGLAASPPRVTQQLLAGVMPCVDPEAAPHDAVSAGEAVRAAPLAAVLEKWPWRKWHCMTGADGLHLWLRDAGVTPHDPALQRWLGDLQRTLAAAGTPLASFTLNGKACSVSSTALKGS